MTLPYTVIQSLHLHHHDIFVILLLCFMQPVLDIRLPNDDVALIAVDRFNIVGDGTIPSTITTMRILHLVSQSQTSYD